MTQASNGSGAIQQIVQTIMVAAPTTHITLAGQAILFRGAGPAIVWPQLVALLAIGGAFFGVALRRFRRTIGQMAQRGPGSPSSTPGSSRTVSAGHGCSPPVISQLASSGATSGLCKACSRRQT